MSNETNEQQHSRTEFKGFQFGRCKATVVTTEDGKRHIELDCQSKKDRDEAAAVLEEESLLRVNPKVVLDDTPPAGPPAGPPEEPVTES
ncbi:hypothetical protein ES705_46567 [subsurface metagenome]